MCGEHDTEAGGDDVMVSTQEEAEIAVTGGRRPVWYSATLDCLISWFDAYPVEAEPGLPSEASCADWQAGLIGLKPRPPKPTPAPPLSIPLRAISFRVGSAPLLEHSPPST